MNLKSVAIVLPVFISTIKTTIYVCRNYMAHAYLDAKKMIEEIEKLRDQRAALLTACETALPVLMEYHRRHYLDFATDRDVRKAIAQLRDAIERVKGGGE